MVMSLPDMAMFQPNMVISQANMKIPLDLQVVPPHRHFILYYTLYFIMIIYIKDIESLNLYFLLINFMF